MSLASIRGCEIHYTVDDFTDPWRDRASVKTVFMHHAFFRGLDSLAGWVPALARHYRVVRIDSRGFGGSATPKPPFEMTMQHLADDVIGLLDHLGIDKVHYLGVASGGIAGQMLAATKPQRIESLTLCDSPHRLNDAVKTKLSLGEPLISDAMRKHGFKEWRRRTLDSTLDPRQVDARMTRWQLELQSRVADHIAISQEYSLETSDTAGILADIRCPTLILCGDRSVFTPLEMLAFMTARIPQSRLQVFPHIGSTLSVMHAEACARAMLAFVQEMDAGEHTPETS